MKLRYKILGTLVPLLGLLAFVYLKGRRAGARTQVSAANHSLSVAVLPSNVSERITVNPSTHKLVIQRPGKKLVTETLPDRLSTIDVQKDGSVKIMAAQYGFEKRLFLGAGYSDTLRYGLGLDGFYWKTLDLGGGLQVNSHFQDIRAFLALSYTIKDNLRMTVTYDHKQTIGAMLTLRI